MFPGVEDPYGHHHFCRDLDIIRIDKHAEMSERYQTLVMCQSESVSATRY